MLYIGLTNDIARRLYEHKQGQIEGFSKRYNVKKLVYLEEFSQVEDAIQCEKQLKNWRRSWKIKLIRKKNPYFKDLSEAE